MGSISSQIMPLVINSLGGGHTSNSKNPGTRQPAAGVPDIKIILSSAMHVTTRVRNLQTTALTQTTSICAFHHNQSTPSELFLSRLTCHKCYPSAHPASSSNRATLKDNIYSINTTQISHLTFPSEYSW